MQHDATRGAQEWKIITVNPTAPSNPLPLPHLTMEAVKIATLKINGIATQTGVGMIEDFIRRQDFDILLVQEVTNPDIMNMRGYVTHLNIGTTMR
jgi:hypothetical protein